VGHIRAVQLHKPIKRRAPKGALQLQQDARSIPKIIMKVKIPMTP
jgi:hypothetical protein